MANKIDNKVQGGSKDCSVEHRDIKSERRRGLGKGDWHGAHLPVASSKTEEIQGVKVRS